MTELATMKALYAGARSFLSQDIPWLERMVDISSHRFYYTCRPTGERRHQVSPIRDLATVHDAHRVLQYQRGHGGQLSAILPLAMLATSSHYCQCCLAPVPGAGPGQALMLLPHDGDRPNIAHTALAALACDCTEQVRAMGLLETSQASGSAGPSSSNGPAVDWPSVRHRLLAGLWGQRDGQTGRFAIAFDGKPASGEEFYPGEAMMVLAKLRPELCSDLLASHGVYLDLLRREAGSNDEEDRSMVPFFGNWLAQAGDAIATAAGRTGDSSTLAAARASNREVCSLILASDLVQELRAAGVHHGQGQQAGQTDWQRLRYVATVQVACAYEGLAHTLPSLLAAAGSDDAGRAQAHTVDATGGQQPTQASTTALLDQTVSTMLLLQAFLLEVQRRSVSTGTAAAGGLGHGLFSPEQRVDVTGHAISGAVRLLEALEYCMK